MQNWLARNLSEAGHHVIYATPKIDEKFKSDLVRIGLDKVITVIEYPWHIKKRYPFRYIAAIKKIYEHHRVNLLINFGGTLFEEVIARRMGVKVLLSERCDPTYHRDLHQILTNIQFKFADGYVFQTPEAAAYYGKRAQRVGKVIPNPIIDKLGNPQFDNLRKEIVSVGRLSKEKNQEGLIEAFSMFHKKHPDYILKLYGSGPLEELFIKRINELALQGFVEIIKGKTNISELIKGAELFVLNSFTEGMPNALIEAMSMGVLSVSTDCPIYGPRLLVNHGENAYLTPVDQPDKLAEMMCYAVEHTEEGNRIRHNAVEIRERLCSEKIFAEWNSYILSL